MGGVFAKAEAGAKKLTINIALFASPGLAGRGRRSDLNKGPEGCKSLPSQNPPAGHHDLLKF